MERALSRAPVEQQPSGGLLTFPVQDYRQPRLQVVPVPPPKWELPSFEGYDPKVWILKCERYLNLYRTSENQKVEVAALYLNGLAENWYHSLVLSVEVLGWVEFKEELYNRFQEELLEDAVDEFNKLSQTGAVDEFPGRFEDLKAQTIIKNPALTEAHFLSSFIGALKEEIKFAVRMFKPTTLKDAIQKARMQEKVIEVVQRRHKPIPKPHPMVNQATNSRSNVTSTSRNTHFRISPEVYEYRKSNHLCFRCGEKYVPGHQCPKKQLNYLKGESEPSHPALGMTEHNSIIVETSTEISELPPDVVIEGYSEQAVVGSCMLKCIIWTQ